jgi:hypothetical protein
MKKPLKGERAKELSRRVSELKQELERLPPDRQDAFRELLGKQTRRPRKRGA